MCILCVLCALLMIILTRSIVVVSITVSIEARSLVHRSSNLVNHFRWRVVKLSKISTRVLIVKRTHVTFCYVPCRDELVHLVQSQPLLLQQILLQIPVKKTRQNSVHYGHVPKRTKTTEFRLQLDRLHEILIGFIRLLVSLTKTKALD
uniref:(northern house mosquito) hypothetical protein n=1 Tax=Culex pipiens TaxID=7175 RepID=A0A8D8GHM4_CULPI